jgi:hypothetical protein
LCDYCKDWYHNICVETRHYNPESKDKSCFYCTKFDKRTEYTDNYPITKTLKWVDTNPQKDEKDEIPKITDTAGFATRVSWTAKLGDQVFKAGQFVYVTRKNLSSNEAYYGRNNVHVMQICYIVLDDDNTTWFWGQHLYSPLEIMRNHGVKYYPNELFLITDHQGSGWVRFTDIDVTEPCLVVNVGNFRDGQATGVKPKNTFVMQDSYSCKAKNTSKSAKRWYTFNKQDYAYKKFLMPRPINKTCEINDSSVHKPLTPLVKRMKTDVNQ